MEGIVTYNPRRIGGAGSRRNAIRKQLRATVTHCAICGGVLDWDAKYEGGKNPAYVELDEIIPVSHWSKEQQVRACTDIENIQAVHRLCNQRKGKKIVSTAIQSNNQSKPLKTSQRW